jgi:hypothetical protein
MSTEPKYGYRKGLNDHYTVYHSENGTETFIATTDTAEKADFITKACIQFALNYCDDEEKQFQKTNPMTTKQIDNMVIEIMITDGPDGHCDGHEVITSFITALLEGKGEEWSKGYCNRQSSAVVHSYPMKQYIESIDPVIDQREILWQECPECHMILSNATLSDKICRNCLCDLDDNPPIERTDY